MLVHKGLIVCHSKRVNIRHKKKMAANNVPAALPSAAAASALSAPANSLRTRQVGM